MEHNRMPRHPPESTHGFSLVEMAIVLLIIGLAAGMIITVSGSMLDAQKRQTVRTQLDTLDTALANFVAKNKRLPCPADGAIASGQVNAGVERPFPATGVCDPASVTRGVVPWVTLGVSESDAADQWYGRITYRVDPALAQIAPLPMDMGNCDPAAAGLTAGGACQVPAVACAGSLACTSPSNFLANKGLDVWNGVGGVAGWGERTNNRSAGTGAAYVIISHGPTGAGAYNKNGALPPRFLPQPGTLSIPNPPGPAVQFGADEGPNANNQALVLSLQATSYRDAALNDVRSLAHFDDYLSHPTIMSVLNKANLGPRAH